MEIEFSSPAGEMDTSSSRSEATNLEELQASSKELKSINLRQEQRVRYERTRAEIFTVAYLLLQCLYFIAISILSSSPSSFSKPRKWLLPFVTKLLTSVFFFMAISDAAVNFYWTQYELDINYVDLDLLQRKIREAKYGAVKSESHSLEHRRIKPDVVLLFKRRFYICSTTLVLLAFAVTDLYACRLLLSGDNRY